MNGIAKDAMQAIGLAQVTWLTVGLLIETHPDGRRFAELLLRSCDAWVTRLDVPATPEVAEVHHGYLAAISELRSAAQRLIDRTDSGPV